VCINKGAPFEQVQDDEDILIPTIEMRVEGEEDGGNHNAQHVNQPPSARNVAQQPNAAANARSPGARQGTEEASIPDEREPPKKSK